MKDQSFEDMCKEKFSFLIDQYQLKALKVMEDAFSIKIIYKNNDAGISIIFEPRENDIYVVLHRLVNRKIDKSYVSSNTKRNSFYVYDLMKIRKPAEKEREIISKSKFKGPLNMKLLLKAYANYLQKNAGDILKGDFSIFSELEKV